MQFAMFSGIQERIAGSLAFLSKERQALMPYVKKTITDWRKLSRKDLLMGVNGDFVPTLLSLAIITYFIWGFHYVDRLYDRIVLNLYAAVFVPITFYKAMRQERERFRPSLWSVVVVFFLALVLAYALTDKFGLDALGINAAMIILSYPWLVIFGMLVRQKRILAIGMVPAAIILMAYWVMPTPYSELNLQDFLLLLVAVSFVIAVWTVPVWIFFKGLDRWPEHPTLAPLMESLAMLFLFMPLMVLAIWVPKTIPGGDDWSVVVAAIVGVVFGSVISEPIRDFLRSYGNLPSRRRCAKSNEVTQGRDTSGDRLN